MSDSFKVKGKCRSGNYLYDLCSLYVCAEVSLLLVCVKDGRFCYLCNLYLLVEE